MGLTGAWKPLPHDGVYGCRFIKKKYLSAQLSALFAKTSFFSPVANKLSVSDIQSCAITSYVHSQLWNQQFIKIGEAAFTIDPLSSTGVEKAMRFSLQVAIAVNTLLKYHQPVIAQSFYEEKLIESVVTHAQWTSDYYANAWPAKGQLPFWEKRAAFQLNLPKSHNNFISQLQKQFKHAQFITRSGKEIYLHVDAVLSSLWNEQIRLSPDLVYKDVFSIVDDRIEIRQAIEHPNFEIAIVYLDQIEIKPLLDMVGDEITFGSLIVQWGNLLAPEKAKKMAVYFWCNDIITVNL